MKSIIVYYSLEGNTKYIAELLAKETDADVLELKPKKEYPKGAAVKFIAGGFAATVSAHPQLGEYAFDASAYDLIILGSPVWNSRITPPLNTFIDNENIKDKRIAMFACQSGNGADKLFSAVEAKLGKLAFTATFIDPLSHKEEANEQLTKFIGKVKALG